MLVYTGIVTPYIIVFLFPDPLWAIVIEITLDVLFAIDVGIHWVLAYFDEDNELVTDRRKIFMRYLKSWMIIDIIAWIPIDLIFKYSDDYTDLIKLARLPRLFRLVKIGSRGPRIMKHRKAYKNRVRLCLHMSVGMERMLWFILTFIIIVHLISCFWGLIGLSESDPSDGEDLSDSWIDEYGF